MKKIIVLIREENDDVRNKYYIDAIKKFGGEVVLVYDSDDIRLVKNKVEEADGILLTGGENIGDLDFYLIDYAIKNDIRLLGICLGMQAMSLYGNNSELGMVGDNSHNNTYHTVRLLSGRLKDIIGDDLIKVNSYHFEKITDSNNFKTVGISDDGIIEAIENSDHYFQIGVQWHPERIIDSDNSKRLFKSFLN